MRAGFPRLAVSGKLARNEQKTATSFDASGLRTAAARVAGRIFAIVVIALTSYLTFAALQEEHGLFSLFRVQAEDRASRGAGRAEGGTRDDPEQDHETLTDTLDLDLLDEQARKVLALGRSDEIILP